MWGWHGGVCVFQAPVMVATIDTGTMLILYLVCHSDQGVREINSTRNSHPIPWIIRNFGHPQDLQTALRQVGTTSDINCCAGSSSPSALSPTCTTKHGKWNKGNWTVCHPNHILSYINQVTLFVYCHKRYDALSSSYWKVLYWDWRYEC